jgi:lysophospholipase L1-like esterase
MQIDLTDCSLYRGVSQCLPEQGGLLELSRMSDKLNELYSYSEAAIIRACCTTGVRLVFETDSTWLQLRWRTLRMARDVHGCDLEVDGFPVFACQPENSGQERQIRAELPGKGRRKVTLYLPHLCELRLLSLELANHASFGTVAEKRRRLLLTGDSILQGMTTTSPAQAYGTALAHAFDLDYLNIAVGGAVMNGAVAEAAAELPWDIALVAFGVNDCNLGVGLEKEARETEATLRALTSTGRKVILFTPLPWPGRGDKDLDSYIACQKNVAAKFPGVIVLDGYDAVSIDQENFIDSCHPNDLGNHRIAEFLIRNLSCLR